jgi:AcrR family transcriptional regulator
MPNRAAPLSWTPSPARTELVEAALALADRDGLDAVSIRRVAAEVGQRPMSLYTHVASKDDLVALMFDAISAELLVPEPLPTDGRERLRLIARRSFETYLAHPWMLHAFSRRPAAGPNQLRRAEQSAQAVEALGIRPEQAWTALGIVHEWTMGHALHVVTLREDKGLADHLRGVDPERFPRTAGALSSGSGPAGADRFEEALESILDGIEQRFGR